jgi:hypothetical protein
MTSADITELSRFADLDENSAVGPCRKSCRFEQDVRSGRSVPLEGGSAGFRNWGLVVPRHQA